MNDNESGPDDIDATRIPRNRCTSIVDILKHLAAWSEGKMTIAEFADALSSSSVGAYNGETMMLYHGGTAGLVDPIKRSTLHSGAEKRSDVIDELFNIHFWTDPDATITVNGNETTPQDILVEKNDGAEIARRLWRFAFPDDERFIDETTLPAPKERDTENRRAYRREQQFTISLMEADKKGHHFLIETICEAVLKTDADAIKLFEHWIDDGYQRIFGDMARMALHKIAGETACDPSANYWRLIDWAMDHAPSPPHLFFDNFNVCSRRDLVNIVLRTLEGERFFGTTIWWTMEHVYHGVPVYRADPDGTYEEVERDAPDMQAMRYLGRSGICSNAGLSMFPDIMRPEYCFKASDLEAYKTFFHGEVPSDEKSIATIRNAYRQRIGASDYDAPGPQANTGQDEVERLKMELRTVKKELADARQTSHAKENAGSAQTSRWPWGEYTTPTLELLAKTVRRYCATGEFQGKPIALTEELVQAGLGGRDDVKRLTAAFDPDSMMNKRAATAKGTHAADS